MRKRDEAEALEGDLGEMISQFKQSKDDSEQRSQDHTNLMIN